MKKQMKQVAAATLAALCFGAVAIPTVASAATITVNDNVDNIDLADTTLEAYKIFDVTETNGVIQIVADDTLTTDVIGVFKTQIANAMAAEGYVSGSLTAIVDGESKANSAVKIGDYLNYIENDNDAVIALARALKGKVGTAVGEWDKTSVANQATVTVDDAGYYLITGITKDGDEIIHSSVMLKATNDSQTLYLKADKPTITKKIVEGNNRVDANTAGIGETVIYELTSQVPDTTYYKDYTFVMKDTLSAGLTYTADSVTVTVGGEDVTTGYAVYTNVVNNETLINIVFTKMKDWGTNETGETDEPQAGEEIKVQFEAVVNENAKIWNDEGNPGNPNEVILSYSNNPNVEVNWSDKDGDGTPDDKDENDESPDTPPETPDPNNPTEDTPKDDVITYVTELKIHKQDELSAPMDGISFQITGEGVTYYVNVGTAGEIKVSTTNNLTNGTDKFVNDKATADTSDDETITAVAGKTDADGNLVFTGLDAGTYTISEIAAPAGYIKAGDLVITIGETYTVNENDATENTFTGFTYQESGKTATASNEFTIINQRGTTLPSTGGIGTTIFTIVGLTLMATATGAFIIKRKVTAQ